MLHARPIASLCVAITLALAGCGELGEGDASGSFEPSQRGTLKVATEPLPTAGFWEGTADDPTGGFEYELAEALRERFDLRRLEIVEVPFADLIEGDLGDADLALALMTPTAARETELDFSDPYLRAPPAFLTDAGLELPDLETARELTYAVEVNTTLVDELESSVDPLEPPLILPDRDAVLEALAEGEADAAVFDLPAAQALASESAGELHVAAKLGTDEAIAAALPDDSQRNAEAVSSAIRALQADGTLEELSERWLGAELTRGAQEVPLLRSSR